MSKNKVTPLTASNVATLANIPISTTEAEKLAEAFGETLDVVDELQQLNTKNVATTHQVTGLTNIWREDAVDDKQTFSQEEALKNAKKTYQGFFMVPMLLENKDT